MPKAKKIKVEYIDDIEVKTLSYDDVATHDESCSDNSNEVVKDKDVVETDEVCIKEEVKEEAKEEKKQKKNKQSKKGKRRG